MIDLDDEGGARAAKGAPVAGDLSVGEELTYVFARATGALPSAEVTESALHLVTSVAVHTVEAATGAGVSVMDTSGARTTTGASDERVERADTLQYDLDEGPCLDAWAGRAVVRSDDLADETRWPRWAAAARSLGLRSTLSAPLVAGDDAVGTIKLYGSRARAFTERDEGTLLLLAAQAAVLVTGFQAVGRAGRLSAEVRGALRRRDVVNLAKGVVMGRDGATPDGAFAHLVSLAERDHRPVHEVASRIVDTAQRRTR